MGNSNIMWWWENTLSVYSTHKLFCLHTCAVLQTTEKLFPTMFSTFFKSLCKHEKTSHSNIISFSNPYILHFREKKFWLWKEFYPYPIFYFISFGAWNLVQNEPLFLQCPILIYLIQPPNEQYTDYTVLQCFSSHTHLLYSQQSVSWQFWFYFSPMHYTTLHHTIIPSSLFHLDLTM